MGLGGRLSDRVANAFVQLARRGTVFLRLRLSLPGRKRIRGSLSRRRRWESRNSGFHIAGRRNRCVVCFLSVSGNSVSIGWLWNHHPRGCGTTTVVVEPPPPHFGRGGCGTTPRGGCQTLLEGMEGQDEPVPGQVSLQYCSARNLREVSCECVNLLSPAGWVKTLAFRRRLQRCVAVE